MIHIAIVQTHQNGPEGGKLCNSAEINQMIRLKEEQL